MTRATLLASEVSVCFPETETVTFALFTTLATNDTAVVASGKSDELLRKALADPREPRPVPAKVSPVLETVTMVLERAGEPMRVCEIHAAAEQLAGKPLLWKSVKAALAVNAEGEEASFVRVRRGCYRIGTAGTD